MIRRRATPAVILFSCLLASLAGASAGRAALAAPAAAALGAAALGVALLRASAGPARRGGELAVSAAVGLALGAALLARVELERSAAYFPVRAEELTSVTGRLRQDSLLTREGDTLLRVRLSGAASSRRDVAGNARGDVVLVVSGDWRFSMGEVLEVRGTPRELSSAGGSGGSLERYGIWAERGQVASRGFVSPVWAWRGRVREEIHRAISRVGWPASGLLEALMIGSREEVPADLQEGFRRTGSLHVLALSGLHAGILYGFAALLLRPLPGRVVRFIAGTLFLAAYQLVAGFSPSLLRATIMIVVGGVGFLLDRDVDPLNLLALAGIVILAIDPLQAFSVSFQLSFLALAGILAIGPAIARPLAPWVPGVVLQPLAASLGAQLATLPVVLLVFGAYFPSGILAALPLVPLVTVILWVGLAWLLIYAAAGGLFAASAVHWLAQGAVPVFGALYAVISRVTGVLARLPGVTVGAPASAVAAIAAAAVAAGVALFLPIPSRARARQ